MDKEARLHGTTPAEHPEALRLWLRLLTCTQLIETQVRSGLRDQFDTTLPRFDLMAQLERVPQGMKMGELSKRMMVTGGNVTGITDQLVNEGLVERIGDPVDRRAWIVKLTARGHKVFQEMASAHELWIVELLSGLSTRQSAQLYALLATLKKRATALVAADRPGSIVRATPADSAPSGKPKR